jgi:hypothetical protein
LDGSRGAVEALDWLERNLDRFRRSTEGMMLASATEGDRTENLTDAEQRVLDALAMGPCNIAQLALRLEVPHS